MPSATSSVWRTRLLASAILTNDSPSPNKTIMRKTIHPSSEAAAPAKGLSGCIGSRRRLSKAGRAPKQSLQYTLPEPEDSSAMNATTPTVGRRSRVACPSEHDHGKEGPKFIRLPKPGSRCPWTGLSRGSMNDLILGPSPLVRSLVITQPGAKRGIRLIDFDSLLSYLDSLLQIQVANSHDGREGSRNV